MICPKCGLEQPDAPECKSCGVIVAKYRAREAQPRPGATAAPPPPLPDLPPPSDISPGWSRDSGGAPPGPVASRYTAASDPNAFRRVQAQAATKRFVLVLLVIGAAVGILTVFVSFFRVYNNLAKLELDVTSDAADLANMNPEDLRLRVKKHVESYGFQVKDDRIRIAWEDFNGKPLAQELLSAGGISMVTAKVTIQLVALTKAVGIPISFNIEASTVITRRASVQDFRRWATDDYGEGKPVEAPSPEAEPEPEPAEPAPEPAPEYPSEPPSEGQGDY